jgi:hypothetical protein
MTKYFAGAVLIGVVGLAGCASPAETEAYRKYQAERDAGKETLVGSRLIKPTTERVVKAVGNDEYNQENQHTGIANKFPQGK